MSGTYVANGPTETVLVQIVETGGGSFSGRYEEVVLKADGRIEDTNATISGARDGETVVATIKPAGLLAVSEPVSGKYRSGVLHLSGGTDFAIDLPPGTKAEFHARVAVLTAEGRRIADARTREQAAAKEAKLEWDRLSSLKNLTEQMIAFNRGADQMLPKFKPVEQRWRDITERMRGGLARQKSMYREGQAALARAQITVALNQAAIDANQVHIGTQTSYQSFSFKSDQLSHEAAEDNAWCRGTVPDTLSVPCVDFAKTNAAFVAHASLLKAAFSNLEDVWNTEKRKQEDIVQTSQHIQ
ncbi:MAG: hypothetical protein ACREFL_18505 [Stellaceae bacterium]